MSEADWGVLMHRAGSECAHQGRAGQAREAGRYEGESQSPDGHGGYARGTDADHYGTRAPDLHACRHIQHADHALRGDPAADCAPLRRGRGRHAAGRGVLVRLDDVDHVPRDGAARADRVAQPHVPHRARALRHPAGGEGVGALEHVPAGRDRVGSIDHDLCWLHDFYVACPISVCVVLCRGWISEYLGSMSNLRCINNMFLCSDGR